MHTYPTPPSAHACTPRPERRHKPRNYGRVIAGDGSDPLTSSAKRDHRAEWNALNSAQKEVQARDQLVAMRDRTPWNSPELMALSYAVAVLTVKIEGRQRAEGGAV
jgi:hypothetical protein